MQVTLASLTLAQKCAKALKEKTSPSLDYIIMRERRTRRHLFHLIQDSHMAHPPWTAR